MMYKNYLQKKGFTILESLISISILSVAVTGPLVYVTNSLKAAEVARDQTIAFYLAQDAVEHIKNVRDNNTIGITNRSLWLDGLGACDDTACHFDRNNITVPITCSSGVCPALRQNGVGEFFQGYGYGDLWEESRFTRTIIIEKVPHAMPSPFENTPDFEEARVTVTVGWSTRDIVREVVVVEHIFNLHNAPQYES